MTAGSHAEEKPPPARSRTMADLSLTPGRFALVLATCIFVANPEVVLGARTFFFRDFAFFGYPLAHYHRESFWRGEIPLWNPLNNCGLPFLAQWNTLVLYPGSLFYLLFPLSWALAVFCLLHQFLAGLGMYFLAGKWTGNRFAAAVAGLAFANSGLVLNCLMWPNNIAALGWMPWVVLLAEQAWIMGGQKVPAAAAVGAIQMLTGAPEIIALTWLTVAIFALSASLRNGATVSKSVRRFLLMAALVGALSAVQLAPFLDLLRHAQRDVGYGDSAWAMPKWGWVNLFVPLFHCLRGFHGVYWQADQYWTSSYYPGAAIVTLAAFAALFVNHRPVRVLAVLTVLGLVLAAGDNGFLFLWLRRAIPQFGFMRFPIKFMVLVSFALPLLAAFGIGHLLEPATDGARRRWKAAGALAAISIFVMLGAVWYVRLHPLPKEDWMFTAKNGLARVIFLMLILGTLYLCRRTVGPLLRKPAMLMLLLLVSSDLLTHVPWQNPSVSRKVYEPGLVRLTPQPRHGEARAMISPANVLKLYRFATTNAFNDCICNRLTLFANCNLLDRIPKADGFYSLYLREADAVKTRLYDSTNQPPAPLADFLGVEQITDPENFLEWQVRPTFMPLTTVGQEPVFADETTTFKAITGPDFDPRQTVYLPLDARALATASISHKPTPNPSQPPSHRTGGMARREGGQGNVANGPARTPPSSYLSSVRRTLGRSADFQSAVSPNCIRRGVGSVPHFVDSQRLAKCDSAMQMQQSATLRYDAAPSTSTSPRRTGSGFLVAGKVQAQNEGQTHSTPRARSQAEAKVVAAAFSAHRAEIQVEAPTPSWLVIAQNNHHWWRAYLDGAPFRLWRANYAFQAVAVPGGQHLVRLVYRDWGFVAGALLSVLTLMGCIAFLNLGPHCSPGELTPQSGSKLHALQTLPRR